MGLGKTITTVSLIACTLKSAEAFSKLPLPPLPRLPSPEESDSDTLLPDHFSGAVWGMPRMPGSGMINLPALSKKEAARQKATAKAANAVYTRQARIKTRSRATLIICPLSTVSNWEEQFKEHWAGEVVVVGGSGEAAKEKEPVKPKKEVKEDKGTAHAQLLEEIRR